MSQYTRLAAASLALFLGAAASAEADPCTEANSISRVRNRTNAPYEYLVFNFVKPPTLPSYSVTTATPPFIQDPSGEPVTVNGDRFKRVRFEGVVWTCSIEEIFVVPRQAIKDVKNTGQFEGIIEYVVGYGGASQYLNTYTYDAGGIRKIVLRFRK
jgi:hypothetical protein